MQRLGLSAGAMEHPSGTRIDPASNAGETLRDLFGQPPASSLVQHRPASVPLYSGVPSTPVDKQQYSKDPDETIGALNSGRCHRPATFTVKTRSTLAKRVGRLGNKRRWNGDPPHPALILVVDTNFKKRDRCLSAPNSGQERAGHPSEVQTACWITDGVGWHDTGLTPFIPAPCPESCNVASCNARKRLFREIWILGDKILAGKEVDLIWASGA